MQIQVNTDNHITGSDALSRHVETIVEGALGHFGERLTRVEVHLSDANAAKKSDDDKRCVLEARVAGLKPITVSDVGATLDQALGGAADKLEKTLARTLKRRDAPKGRTSYAGLPDVAAQDAGDQDDAI